MKKILMVLILVAIVATGTVFASDPRPSGLGIGAQWGTHGGWGNGNIGLGNVALALKLPSAPPYLGINLGINDNWFSLGLSADWNFVGGDIVPVLGWYIDLGGYVGFSSYDDKNNNKDDWARVNLGARLPIGLTIKPLPILDIYLAIVPSLGLGLRVSGKGGDGFHFPDGGWGGNLGIRVWL